MKFVDPSTQPRNQAVLEEDPVEDSISESDPQENSTTSSHSRLPKSADRNRGVDVGAVDPVDDSRPRQVLAPAEGKGTSSAQRRRRTARKRILKTASSTISQPAIHSLLLGVSQSACLHLALGSSPIKCRLLLRLQTLGPPGPISLHQPSSA
ncbi:hypothetical protein PCANC_03488 [Puccinia coronata f. sp. avenae]|uniref:Uncharacterized protein n=1 Tax=Puccinia coronata f. sp. avenae TaxID=200324 RepID=A0A2N5W059_9BASI|nr:hypothetical protein PCANC_03488 [Puccinia coronata f. sp. avenae]